MRVIGLDIGTTTLCALVLDGGTGEVLHSETVKNDSFLPSPHPWEKLQDPRRIETLALGLAESLKARFSPIGGIA